ncbi:hypothetical protein FIBSPDRAFT_873794 [Athelia psychrophila]|uniref:Uncharacterized protein n=1 Tax=Athelia psychrophila TaxID=1759441 RepID=A0A165Y7I1_9AGAM|nr:hypothetical protein FIBSPDRAFT_873794 [Fibularhizoctonia sp. CBS 109695]
MPSENRTGASSQLHRCPSSLRIPILCQFPRFTCGVLRFSRRGCSSAQLPSSTQCHPPELCERKCRCKVSALRPDAKTRLPLDHVVPAMAAERG